MYETLLFFHVLAAFFLASGVVIYSAFVFGSPVNGRARLLAEILWGIGVLGTLVLGIWLALNRPEYEIWDGWIIAALVLWLAATGTGQQVSMAFQPRGDDSPIPAEKRVVLMHWLRILLVVALLVVMVWKPGA
jgi:uncharacterized membrane protein